MEERISWGEAVSVAWNNLAGINNEGGSLRLVRGLFFLIFALGTGWAVWNFINAQVLLEPPIFNEFESTPPNDAQADKQRLDGMLREVDLTSKIRAGSSTMAGSMASLSMYPFGDPLLAERPEPTVEEPAAVFVPEVVIEYPPEIILKAIMIMGKQQVAVMDISGVGNGMVVKVGDTFMQKKGRIVRIAPDKVVVRWGGKNWDIAPSF
ncbi:MAG: hypothetical protein LBQ42_12080 [Synergistaceae bacterium]|jgi:hypothetical protein|nr:hypothetical protein [Synergistaceae bacterium]